MPPRNSDGSNATQSKSSQLLSSDHMEVDLPASSQPLLSNDVLQERTAEHQVERDQRHTNRNQIPHVQHKTGAPLNKLCASW